MRELMKFRGQEAIYTRPTSSSSSSSSSNRRSFRSSSAVGTEIGLAPENGTPGTTKVEVLSDGLKWLVIYSLLPSSSAGAAMSGGIGNGLEVVSNTGGLGSLGSKVIEAYYAVNSGMSAIALGSLNQAAMIGAVAGVVNQIVKEQQDKVTTVILLLVPRITQNTYHPPPSLSLSLFAFQKNNIFLYSHPSFL